ncbi:hypothetical protein N7499_002927 [Penicillium canescens]|uniref:Alcohol dehydrogenase iron-type/glycerol dehydrogenase GldA domain-containing protein n=1 Tax=Penicillium canescens TaxID=5083 RepID=A0AAD6IB73_PENCN|nr:hypothetical protein N7522_013566 [Penicillium canescens]KAJ6022313.1 hypothetical protein N7460_014057 [Penicillium canescens]KAJ6041261.1 hypothetical protein N7460_006651 [Penicillium canescens]KAJ6094331.1 hypothetical protein N7499_002927 [Penicillium canescens]KAJ6174628.1 hypothetical protein N7485_005365 [Penicillium canescens]
MDALEYNPNLGRAVLGSGTLQKLPDEIVHLQVKAPLVLSTPYQLRQAETVKDVLKGQVAGIFSEATMHTPTNITDKALECAKAKGADSVISIGGGSTIGLGKAISIRTGLPHICIPTTYAVVSMLSLMLALYARNTNPIITMMALEGTRALASSLPEIVENLSSQSARSKALYGAWLCGTCLVSVGIIPEAMKQLADALPDSNGDAIHGLNVLLTKLKVKRGMMDFGMKEEDIDKAADIAISNAYWNPRPIEHAPIRELLRRVWAGEPARADL